MSSFTAFLHEIVDIVTTFTNIDFIHIKEQDDGCILAMATANDGSVNITATSLTPININDIRICVGNLRYLKQILNMHSMDTDSSNYMIYDMEKNDKKIATSIQFTPNSRMEMNYVCTNPFRFSVIKPSKINIIDWPIGLLIDELAITEFREMKRVHSASPSTGKQDVISLSYNDTLMINFGEAGGIQKSVLTMDTSTYKSNDKLYNIYLLTEQLDKCFVLSQDSDNIIDMKIAEKEIQTTVDKRYSTVNITLIGRKVRNQ